MLTFIIKRSAGRERLNVIQKLKVTRLNLYKQKYHKYNCDYMAEMVTIKLPKKDLESFLRVVDDIRFIKQAEKGDEEISKGKYKTLNQLRKKYKVHR